jgi:hypothetical protein
MQCTDHGTEGLTLFLLKGYQLIMDRRFVWPNDPESYAGWSVSSW